MAGWFATNPNDIHLTPYTYMGIKWLGFYEEDYNLLAYLFTKVGNDGP